MFEPITGILLGWRTPSLWMEVAIMAVGLPLSQSIFPVGAYDKAYRYQAFNHI
jgi:hypothetical protein